jgi:hypothetical protein
MGRALLDCVGHPHSHNRGFGGGSCRIAAAACMAVHGLLWARLCSVGLWPVAPAGAPTTPSAIRRRRPRTAARGAGGACCCCPPSSAMLPRRLGLLALLLLALPLPQAAGLQNGFQLPQLGWNSCECEQRGCPNYTAGGGLMKHAMLRCCVVNLLVARLSPAQGITSAAASRSRISSVRLTPSCPAG